MNMSKFLLGWRLFVTGLMLVIPSALAQWERSIVDNLSGRSSESFSSSAIEQPGAQQDEVYIDYFDVQNADLRSVFRQLSVFSGVDIVLDEDVKGVVTLTVTNKTWKEILQIVCKVADLMPIVQQTYIFIVTRDTYRQAQLKDAETMQKFDDLGPLSREVIKLNNMPANEMMESVKPLLSPRGKITVVDRYNSLIIFDTKYNIENIKKMINELDIETEQISISCKIIEVGSGVLQQIGIQWGFFTEIEQGSNTHTLRGDHLPGTSVVPSALERLTYGILSQDRFAMTLEYLFQQSKAEVVAQPQITTVENKEARIFMGQQVPVTYLDEAGNTTIRMIDAGTELTVTPHLTNDRRIMLELKPMKKSHEFRGTLPIINEQSAFTNVVVNDGETVVIAGLTSNEVRNTEGGIPLLKDIPLIGHLFKRSSKAVDKKDLIIFVTPHIILKKAPSAALSPQSAQ